MDTGTAPLRSSAFRCAGWIAAAGAGLGFAGLVCWSTATFAADGQATPIQRTFRSSVDVVSLDVCVRRRNGQLAEKLRPEDFLIVEDNKPQQIEFFMPQGRVPLSVALLIDRSSSMGGEKLTRAQQAATAFLRRLEPDDTVEVLTFNELADRRVPLTADRAAAEAAIAGLTAEGQTGLFEAILNGVRDLERARRGRTTETRDVILVLSDGEDTSSRPTFEDVQEDVRRSGIMLYAVSLRTDSSDRCLAPSHELLQLAHDTGGRAVPVPDLAGLTPLYEEIAAELQSLYRLGYVPRDRVADGSWRPISVRLSDPQLIARTRAGYYASKPGVRLTRTSGR